MPDLTLEQVREAGRFAWCWHGVYDAKDDRVMVIEVEDSCELTPWKSNPGGVRDCWHHPLFGDGSRFFFDDGWHHLSGCDCPFCA